MRNFSMLRISDATSLALHTMALLAANSDKLVSNKEIAKMLEVSEAHLSKVLQRLAKLGLVYSIRGPRGGFRLGKDSKKITLLEVYESIEGRLTSQSCLMEKEICKKKGCILSAVLECINKQVKDYLSKTTLDQLVYIFKK